MKLLILFCVICFSFASSEDKVVRRYLKEEDDINYRRFLKMEQAKGVVVEKDLLAEEIILQASADDVTFYLYTRKNQENPTHLKHTDDLANTDFQKDKEIVFISHGWNNNHESSIFKILVPAFLDKYDVNVFAIDWNGPANCNYLTAKNAVTTVGKTVGDFINKIMKTYKLSGKQFTLVGHSLGAHVVGNAGAEVNGTIYHIVGLDPASPLFTIGNRDNRLDDTDGEFVEVIHTTQILGFISAIGHFDYYPNGGHDQPGCGIDLAATCGHSRSYQYFGESIRKNEFFGRMCDSEHTFDKGSCNNNKFGLMGGYKIDECCQGDFYLTTNSVDRKSVV